MSTADQFNAVALAENFGNVSAWVSKIGELSDSSSTDSPFASAAKRINGIGSEGSPVRVGFFCTAMVGIKNWNAIQNLQGRVVVSLLGSRDKSKGEAFLEKLQAGKPQQSAPTIASSYEEFVELSKTLCDVVFVPLPTGMRSEWVTRLAQLNKHIVCEKPTAKTLSELRPILATCKANNLFFVDASMGSHSMRLGACAATCERVLSSIESIESRFCFQKFPDFNDKNIRANADLEPHGTVGDLAWYCLRYAMYICKWRKPSTLKATWTNKSGTNFRKEDECEIALTVPGEASGSVTILKFFCSYCAEFSQVISFSGPSREMPGKASEEGVSSTTTVSVQNFCSPKLNIPTIDVHRSGEDKKVSTVVEPEGDFQERQLWRDVEMGVRGAVSEERRAHWRMVAARTQYLVDLCMESAEADGKEITDFSGWDETW